MSEYSQRSHGLLAHPAQPLDASYAPQRASQELDETAHSDISERASVDDVESETGSTGALETRSLKDHKGEAPRRGGDWLGGGRGGCVLLALAQREALVLRPAGLPRPLSLALVAFVFHFWAEYSLSRLLQ